MELTAVIIDDEANSRSVLSKLLKLFCPHVAVKGEAANITDGYKLIMEVSPHVVFLDIQMPGGDGFALLRKFAEFPFKVIFVTSYDKYALEAIKFNALDYLLKPVEVEDLVLAVSRMQQNPVSNETRAMQIINIIAHVDNTIPDKKIVVHHNDHVRFLSLNDIIYMEGERNYTVIRTLDGSKYTSSKNLGEYEEMLEGYGQFFRISKGFIINLNHLTDYTKGEPCVVTLLNTFSFETSRRKKQQLLEKIR